MPVRTARLAVGQTGAANSTVTAYVCPAGKTAILKDIRLSNTVAAANQTILAVHSGPRFADLFKSAVPSLGIQVLADLFVVLEPGDELVVNSAQVNGIIWYVSGAELDGVAP